MSSYQHILMFDFDGVINSARIDSPDGATNEVLAASSEGSCTSTPDGTVRFLVENVPLYQSFFRIAQTFGVLCLQGSRRSAYEDDGDSAHLKKNVVDGLNNAFGENRTFLSHEENIEVINQAKIIYAEKQKMGLLSTDVSFLDVNDNIAKVCMLEAAQALYGDNNHPHKNEIILIDDHVSITNAASENGFGAYHVNTRITLPQQDGEEAPANPVFLADMLLRTAPSIDALMDEVLAEESDKIKDQLIALINQQRPGFALQIQERKEAAVAAVAELRADCVNYFTHLLEKQKEISQAKSQRTANQRASHKQPIDIYLDTTPGPYDKPRSDSCTKEEKQIDEKIAVTQELLKILNKNQNPVATLREFNDALQSAPKPPATAEQNPDTAETLESQKETRAQILEKHRDRPGISLLKKIGRVFAAVATLGISLGIEYAVRGRIGESHGESFTNKARQVIGNTSTLLDHREAENTASSEASTPSPPSSPTTSASNK